MSYEDAIAVFAAAGRLVDADDAGAIVLVNGEDRYLGRATLVTAAQMMAEVVEQAAPALTYAEAVEVCPTHAEELAGTVWEEAFCPVCEADNTAGGDPNQSNNESEVNIMFHDCPVLNRKHLFASQDGHCKHCRPVTVITGEEAIQMPADDYAELMEPVADQLSLPTFQDLLASVGGEHVYRESLLEITRAKLDGKPGNAVENRVPRKLLNLICTQPAQFVPGLLEEYRIFAGQFGVSLAFDENDVPFHSYGALVHAGSWAATQVELAQHRQALNRTALQQKRQAKAAFVETVRATRQIVMAWAKGDETGSKVLGPNTEETRKLAAEYQAAARKKGFRVRFQLVAS